MSRHHFPLMTMVLLLVMAAPAHAQNQYTEDFTTTTFKDEINTTADWNTAGGVLQLYPFAPSIVGSLDTPGRAWGLDVAGDLLYLADFATGLQVIDIGDPAVPVLLATYDSPNQALDVVVDGDVAYLCDDATGVQVLDVSDPVNPAVLATFNPAGPVRGVCVSGNHLYVTGGGDGLYVLDITDPATPIQVAALALPGSTHKVWVEGNLAFVAARFAAGGFHVVDVTDPANPALVGTHDTAGSTTHVDVAGFHAFVADDGGDLVVLDITVPANPIIVANLSVPGAVNEVAVDGDWLYLAAGTNGLHVVDVRDPSNPLVMFSVDTPISARAVAVAGKHVFIADAEGGLQVAEVREPSLPVPTANWDTPASSGGVAVAGNYAYLADGSAGLRVIDVSDPAAPLLIGNAAGAGDSRGIAVAGQHAFVVDVGSELMIFDISDPANPALVGNCSTLSYSYDVEIAGDIAYVAASGAGLVVVDIADVTNPTVISNFVMSYVVDVEVAGDLAFVGAYYDGLRILNISDPASPTLVGQYDTAGNCHGVALEGDRAYIVDSDPGWFGALDITDPTNPILVGSCIPPDWVYDVQVTGNSAVLGCWAGGVQIVDISDPASPLLAGNLDTPGHAVRVALDGDLAYVADSWTGLQVVRVFQRERNASNNVGQSLPVDGSDDRIVRASLTAATTGDVSWLLSNDGGAKWHVWPPNHRWKFPTSGYGALEWHATLAWNGQAPTVSRLTIEWLFEYATIAAITDIPNDQGGMVRLTLNPSGYDFADEAEQPIAVYDVWRQVTDPVLIQELTHFKRTAKAAGPLPRITYGGRGYVVADGAQLALEFPPGVWEALGSFSATQQEQYIVPAATLVDSTAADAALTTFCVTTHTTVPAVWWCSPPLSGYSVDNIAPGVPTAFSVAYASGETTLDWDDATEPDFQFYRVYRGRRDDFEPTPANLVRESATAGWEDPAIDPWGYYYKITAVDDAGNESAPAVPTDVSGVQDEILPVRTVLLDAVPNPFNPATNITFELAAPGRARLEILDISGRRVAVLLDEQRPAGRHVVIWKGRDDAGWPLASGVYFYRLATRGYDATKRIVLVK